MTTALDLDEVLVAIHIPYPNPGVQFRYRKIRHPASGYAVVGVAVALRLQDGVVSDATIGITGATARADAAYSPTAHRPCNPLPTKNSTCAAFLAADSRD